MTIKQLVLLVVWLTIVQTGLDHYGMGVSDTRIISAIEDNGCNKHLQPR